VPVHRSQVESFLPFFALKLDGVGRTSAFRRKFFFYVTFRPPRFLGPAALELLLCSANVSSVGSRSMRSSTRWGFVLAALIGACGPATPVPTEARSAEPQSALSPTEIASTTQKNVGALNRACAQTAHQTTEVALTISVESDGTVSSITSSADDAALAACVEGQVKGWTFPRSSGKSTVRVPFHFVGNSPANAGSGPVDPVVGAAASSLGAIDVRPCKSPGQPTGVGHVSITFAPSGQAIAADVDAPPFAGTEVGRCIADRYRGARIAPFAGNNVHIGKTFRLE
jgi:hypothetical protein